ncbi:hypothetical protein TNCV_3460581 [Trichonephila clavipes]|nr:hypothetical protein TNCV_3460581 [Trichonephila clavipes]
MSRDGVALFNQAERMSKTAIWHGAAGQVHQRQSLPSPHTHSLDLAPNDYFLFPSLKEHLSGRRFPSYRAVKTAAETWLNEQGSI